MLKKAFFYLTILVGYILVFPAQAGDTILLSIGEWPPYFSQEFKYGGVGSRIVTQLRSGRHYCKIRLHAVETEP